MTAREIWNEYAGLYRRSPEPDSVAMVDYFTSNSRNLGTNHGKDTRVAIVTIAHNEQTLLPRALAGLNQAVGELRNRGINSRVILVDNHSTDATAEIARAFRVEVVEESVKGIGHARQAGLEATLPNEFVVATTDADVVVEADWGVKYCELFIDNPGLVLAYGRIREEFDWAPAWDVWLKRQIVRLGKPAYALIKRSAKFVSCAQSGNMAFERATAIRVGGYNENLKADEDGDLARKLSTVGEVRSADNIRVMHSRRRTVGEGMISHSIHVFFGEMERTFLGRGSKGLQDAYLRDYRN